MLTKQIQIHNKGKYKDNTDRSSTGHDKVGHSLILSKSDISLAKTYTCKYINMLVNLQKFKILLQIEVNKYNIYK